MTRVLISPPPSQIPNSNGIGRIVHAQYKHLHKYGVEIVDSADNADVVACHISGRNFVVDVLHTHGLYWTGDPGGYYMDWHHKANHDILVAARQALAVTVPSEWVAMPFKRDMRISPDVIGHGIDLDEWGKGTPGGYILWNKNRAGDVCDPMPAYEIARRGWQVVSTYAPHNAPATPTMKTIGAVGFDTMREYVKGASIYLATTQETFGIGTLEALACGVPVLGYDMGGTRDIVRHKIDGYLVGRGDIEGLLEGIEYIKSHRRELSANALERAKSFTWDEAMKKYAALYARVAEMKRQETDGVTVVISNYNYGQHVGGCIESALAQTDKPQEIIVVDDGSTDGSREIIAGYPVTLIEQANQGVAAARNNGIRAAKTPFIVSLDADDTIAPSFIASLRPAMRSNRRMGIAYTGLTMNDNGKTYQTGWPPEFSFDEMAKVTNPPANCIPSCCMFRRDMWEKAGGYIQSHAPGEDTEFWVRGLSIGYTAKRVTQEGLFIYNAHQGSASRTKQYHAIDQWHPWMRDGKFPMAAPTKRQPNVRSYEEAFVSVIIPVGPGHGKYLQAAIDSVIGQTWRLWELIVINDSGEELPLTPYPFARVITTEGRTGAANARNLGIEAAKAPLLFFLDADDYIDPETLTKMIDKFDKSDGRYVYSDFFSMSGGIVEKVETKEYNQSEWGWQHNIGALIPTEYAREIGGFDDFINEDWAFWVKCAIHGICGARLSEPLYYYRMDTGKRRDSGFTPDNLKKTLAQLNSAYGAYYTGVKKMSTCCPGGGQAIIAAKQRLGLLPSEQKGDTMELIRLEFTGSQIGAMTYTVNGKSYKGGNNPIHKFVDARPGDVDRLIDLGVFRLVRPPEPEIKPVEDETPKSLLEDEPEKEIVIVEDEPEAQVITLANGVDEQEASASGKALNAHKRGRKAKNVTA